MTTAAVGLIPVVAGYIFYNRWLDLFPQIEFRTWMWAQAGPKWYLASVFTHQGAFSRASSFFVDSTTKDVCGLSIHCINEPGFWTILIAGYLLFWLIVRLTGSVVGAAVAATLWLLSLPVLDGFGWQATMGDRLAALFGLATVHMALWAMRWIDRRMTIARVGLANACVLVPAVLLYNSKEISWLLVPSLVLLAVAIGRDRGLRAIAWRASTLVATTLYSIFRIVDAYVLLDESPASRTLDFAGYPAHNASLYSAYLADRLAPDTLTYVLWTVVLGAMLVTTLLYPTASRERRAQIRVMVWAALSVGGGVVLCLFTPSPGPYLLLLPSTFLWVALAAMWRSIGLSHRIALRVTGAAVAAVAATLLLLGLSDSYRPYGELRSWSSNFSRSLPTIAAEVPLGAPIDFVIGAGPYDAYRFVGTNGQRVIDQFIYHRTEQLNAAEEQMNNVSAPVSSFGGYSIVYDGDMSLVEILHGSRVIYRAPATAS